MLYSLACALAATLLSGIIPTIRVTRRSLAGSLAQVGRSQVSGRHSVQFVLVGCLIVAAPVVGILTLAAGLAILLRRSGA